MAPSTGGGVASGFAAKYWVDGAAALTGAVNKTIKGKNNAKTDIIVPIKILFILIIFAYAFLS